MKRIIIPYNPALKLIARERRNHSSQAEIRLWLELKGRKMQHYDFHRQKPLGNFIVAFFCHELLLAIEIDYSEDSSHEDLNSLLIKKKALDSFGITILRFSNEQVLKAIPDVLAEIENYIFEYEKHTPNPSQEGNTSPI